MLVILTGKSASGKDTLLRELTNQHEYIPFVSETSRPMRPGERDGVDYHFVSRERFLNDIKEGNLIEHRSYDTLVNRKPDTWYYGTPAYELDPNKNYITVVDLDGAATLQDFYKEEQVITFYINVPDYIREKRAKLRPGFDKSEWDRRCLDDAVKFSTKNVCSVCDRVLDNLMPDPKQLVQDFLSEIDAITNEKEGEVYEK